MNPSPTDAHQQDEPSNKKPQIGPALMPGVSEVSERTRQRIDDEMRRIVGEAHDEAVQLIANRERLDSLAEALFQAETLEGPEAYAAAGLATAPDTAAPAEPATLVTR